MPLLFFWWNTGENFRLGGQLTEIKFRLAVWTGSSHPHLPTAAKQTKPCKCVEQKPKVSPSPPIILFLFLEVTIAIFYVCIPCIYTHLYPAFLHRAILLYTGYFTFCTSMAFPFIFYANMWKSAVVFRLLPNIPWNEFTIVHAPFSHWWSLKRSFLPYCK